MHLPVRDVNERRDVAPQVQQRVQLDGGLGGAEQRPRKDRQAQVDGGCVQGVDGVVELKPQVLVGIQRTGDANHGLCELGVDAPVPALIGVGERVARHPAANAHVIELVLVCAQTDFDIAQALAEGELSECHA